MGADAMDQVVAQNTLFDDPGPGRMQEPRATMRGTMHRNGAAKSPMINRRLRAQ